MSPPVREEFKHYFRLTVRWDDVDMAGHVNNAKFFTYSQEARMAYFRELRAAPEVGSDQDQNLIVANAACDFLAQLRYPAELEVGTRIEKIGRSSMNMRAGLFVGERAVAMVSTVVVWFDYRQQKPVPIPEPVRAWIRAYEAIAPVEGA